jgi:hypothetical protein
MVVMVAGSSIFAMRYLLPLVLASNIAPINVLLVFVSVIGYAISFPLVSWYRSCAISCRVSLRGKVLVSALSVVSHVAVCNLPHK